MNVGVRDMNGLHSKRGSGEAGRLHNTGGG